MKNDLLPLFRIRLRGTGLVGAASFMKAPRARIWMLVISLITLVSLLVATNHCAIEGQFGRSVALAPTNVSETAGCAQCAGNSLPSGDKSHHAQQALMACCKSLQAIVSNATTDVPAFDADSFARPTDLPDWKSERGDRERSATNVQWDTGPPKVSSFAELVLQHSILSHAPPRLV
jgi:hypothetical protein